MKRRNGGNHAYPSTQRYRRRRKRIPNCDLYGTGENGILQVPNPEGSPEAIAPRLGNGISQGIADIALDPQPDRDMTGTIRNLLYDIDDAFETPLHEDHAHAQLQEKYQHMSDLLGRHPQDTEEPLHSLEQAHDHGHSGEGDGDLTEQDHDHEDDYEEEDDNGEDSGGDDDDEQEEADQAEVSSNDVDAVMTAIVKRAKILVPWGNMFALLSVCGSIRFTVHQYEVLRFAMTWCRPNAVLPSYRTVRRNQFPFLTKNCFPASRLFKFTARDAPVIRYEEDDDIEPGTQQRQNETDQRGRNTNQEDTTNPTDVRIIFPTEWAKLDVMTSPLYEALFEDFQADRQGFFKRGWTLENSDVVSNKEQLLNPTTGFFVNAPDGIRLVRQDELIKLKVGQFPWSMEDDGPCLPYQLETDHRGDVYMTGLVLHTWCVKVHDEDTPQEEETIPHLTPAHRNLLSYTAVVDAGTETTFQAIINRKGVAPGDMCTLIDVTAQSRENTSSVQWNCILVHRFCTARDGKPSRLILWYKEVRAVSTRSFVTHEQVVRSVMYDTGTGNRTEGSPQTRSGQSRDIGILGEKYVVYRILLYSDDFRAASDKLPLGSAGGCYMLPLNLPPCDRRTRTAVRIVSLTPPGVSTNRVLHAIIPDLVEGTIQGVPGVLPTGETVRIFLDVIGYVGDYPASCHTIDSKTHIANAHCKRTMYIMQFPAICGKHDEGVAVWIHNGRTRPQLSHPTDRRSPRSITPRGH